MLNYLGKVKYSLLLRTTSW